MSVQIGNCCGFWGDRIDASFQMLSTDPNVEYITLDYLSEMSLSIMAVQQEKNPQSGYAADFLEVIETLLPLYKSGRKFKVVTNAGGLNPMACALEVKKRVRHAKIAVVSGDDVRAYFPTLGTANAYLGAEPIVEALRGGADIVVTGRVADPSLTVACAQFHHGWDSHRYDLLAQATVAGHLIECGAQVTGGLMENWLQEPNLAKMGYPIVEIFKDGSFYLKKPEGSGGEITLRGVKEQLVYEIQDPSNYLSPDVTANFLDLHLEERGKDTVFITGAKGKAPTLTYKVSGSERWGWMASTEIGLVGPDLKAKGEKIRSIIEERLGYKLEISASLIGIDGLCPFIPSSSFEALLRLTAKGKNYEALRSFTKELAPFITAGPMGTCAYMGGRGAVRPLFLYRPGLIEKSKVQPKVEFI